VHVHAARNKGRLSFSGFSVRLSSIPHGVMVAVGLGFRVSLKDFSWLTCSQASIVVGSWLEASSRRTLITIVHSTLPLLANKDII